jgi:hypothetical protein
LRFVRYQPEPGAEVTAFGEHVSGADRGHNRGRDDGADTGHRHQPLAVLILAGERFNLAQEASRCVHPDDEIRDEEICDSHDHFCRNICPPATYPRATLDRQFEPMGGTRVDERNRLGKFSTQRFRDMLHAGAANAGIVVVAGETLAKARSGLLSSQRTVSSLPLPP